MRHNSGIMEKAMHTCDEMCDLVGAAGSRPLDRSILCARRAYMFWSASQSPGYWNSAASLWPELSLLLKLCLQHGMTANVQPANAPKHHRYDRLAADYRLWSLVAYTASLLLTKSLLVVYASLETSYREQ